MVNKAIYFALFCSIVMISQSTSGQTFLKKRLHLSVGTSMSLPVLGAMFIGREDLKKDYTLFPPGIEASLGVSLLSRLELNFQVSARALRDIHYRPISGLEFVAYKERHNDDFLLRMDAIKFGAEFKIFEEYAPVGRYITIGSNYFLSKGQVYSTFYTMRFDINYNNVPDPQFETYRMEPWSVESSNMGFSVGFGDVELLTKYFTLDYGMKCNFFFGKEKFEIDYDPTWDYNTYDFEGNFSEPMKNLMLGNLMSSYFLEFYLKFGLLL